MFDFIVFFKIVKTSTKHLHLFLINFFFKLLINEFVSIKSNNALFDFFTKCRDWQKNKTTNKLIIMIKSNRVWQWMKIMKMWEKNDRINAIDVIWCCEIKDKIDKKTIFQQWNLMSLKSLIHSQQFEHWKSSWYRLTIIKIHLLRWLVSHRWSWFQRMSNVLFWNSWLDVSSFDR